MTREQRLDHAIRQLLIGSHLGAEELRRHLFRRNWQVYRSLVRQFFRRTEGST